MLVPLIKGFATFVPKLNRLLQGRTGSTGSARYCYSIWMRHLVMTHESGLPTRPDVVAELGPGKSLGVGCAALLSGANRYFALDVRQHASNQRNLDVFDELVRLFTRREAIPDQTEFPSAKPLLESYEFPAHILTDERLEQALGKDRVASLRRSLSCLGSGRMQDSQIAYISPWYDSDVIEESSVDSVFSQAVLEHVGDLSGTYKALRSWLKPGGVMSHEIDFKSHRTARKWNGHWTYSDLLWKLVVGRRSYLLNREPYSVHIKLLDRLGFRVVCKLKSKSESGISRSQLAPRFRHLSDDDLTTSDAFIQAVCEKT
jgi:hypothetical protein